MAEEKMIRLVLTRQDGPGEKPYSQEFQVPYRRNMNVISVLMEIQRHPVTADGKPVAPVQWESNCLEEVCGACSMVINGRPRQACTALIDQLEQPIHIEPMKTFPVLRDLIVRRDRMFDVLKRIKAWIPVDGTHNLGPGPRQSSNQSEWRYELSKCMTCGVCLQACPNVNERSHFVGPFAAGQVQLFNSHPTGKMNKEERIEAISGPGGIQECGNSQNCVVSCPKGIPLTTAIAMTNREATWHTLKRWFSS